MVGPVILTLSYDGRDATSNAPVANFLSLETLCRNVILRRSRRISPYAAY